MAPSSRPVDKISDCRHLPSRPTMKVCPVVLYRRNNLSCCTLPSRHDDIISPVESYRLIPPTKPAPFLPKYFGPSILPVLLRPEMMKSRQFANFKYEKLANYIPPGTNLSGYVSTVLHININIKSVLTFPDRVSVRV